MHINSAHGLYGFPPKPNHAPTEPREPAAPEPQAKKETTTPRAAEQVRELIPLADHPKRNSMTDTYLTIAHYDQDYPLIDVYA